MKLSISGKKLQTALKDVAPAATSEFGVKLEAKDKSLTLTAFSRGLTIQVKVDAEVEESGVVVVYHAPLTSRVTSLKADDVKLSDDTEKLSIRGGKAKFSIGKLPREGFPKISLPSGEPGKIDMQSFAQALNQVLPSASSDPQRPILNGVLLDPSEDSTTVVATDSYRLAVRKVSLENVAQGAEVIPVSALSALLKLVSSGEVSVRADDKTIAFSSPDKLLVASLLGSQYPNYKSLLPSSFKTMWKVDRTELLDCLGRANVAVDRGADPIHLTISSDGKAVASLPTGDFEEEIAGSLSGEPISFAINPGYFADGVRVCRGGSVTIGLNEPLKPVGLSSEEDTNFRYIVMPVRK